MVIAPWNYPFQLALAPVVAALSAGNTVVLKPSELAPATAAVLESLVNDHFTPDCFAVATGGPELSQALIAARPDHIFYTGSTRVGRIIMREAAERLIPVVLELGGKSPCLVLADADVEVAARRIVWGKFMNCGQTCVAPDYVLVEKPAKDRVVAALKKAIADFYAGGTDDQAESVRRIRENPEYGRIVNDSHFKRLALCIEGQQLLSGGGMDAGERFIAPTLIDEPAWDSPVMSDEIFGPLLPIISFEDLAETLDLVRDRPVPLAFYVFSGNVRKARRIMESLRFGGGCINDTIMHLSNSDLPFGGAGDSGMGDYHGRAGFEAFTHRVSVLENPTAVDPALRYPPYGDRLKFFRKLF